MTDNKIGVEPSQLQCLAKASDREAVGNRGVEFGEIDMLSARSISRRVLDLSDPRDLPPAPLCDEDNLVPAGSEVLGYMNVLSGEILMDK